MTYEDDYKARRTEEVKDKFEIDMCSHMRALILHCEAVGVTFGGCGDCGSAWLDCRDCNKNVDLAHEAFDRAKL